MGKMAYVTVGCSASGKSTWADDYVKHTDVKVTRIERDAVRESILQSKRPDIDVTKVNLWQFWNFKWEGQVTEITDIMMKDAFEQGNDIIVSDTNLNEKRREALVRKLNDAGYRVEVEVFGMHLGMDELWKRDTYRKNTVGHDVIAKQYAEFRQQFPMFEVLSVPAHAPKAVICDLDGTLFTMGDRSPFDWDRVDEDEPNEVLVHALYGMYRKGYEIIFLSGRDAVCYDKCVFAIQDAFMEHYEHFDFKLYTRAKDDMRKDTIVKKELFYEHVDGKYKVEAVFDDRPVVCRLWYEFGFRVYHCANPYLEF